jgi:hypothetical protein
MVAADLADVHLREARPIVAEHGRTRVGILSGSVSTVRSGIC